MGGEQRPLIIQSGRPISEQEVELICETVELFPRLALKELAATVCEHLQWFTLAGTPKLDACEKLLRRLEAAALVRLPPKQRSGAPPDRRIELNSRTAPRPLINGSLADLGRIELQVVGEPEATVLYNEYVERYHLLGYRRPFGYFVRYFINSPRGRLGCLLCAGAAKALRARDHWIGWSDHRRLGRLPWVVNNSRFLLFPWVEVPHLASHVLGKLARRLGEDWQWRWGYRPVLIETFVDPARYQGTCYRAAGWQYLGMTTGAGLPRPGKSYSSSPKMLFVKPLSRQFRTVLCSEPPGGAEVVSR